jgi:hypothetical protein
MALAPAGEKLTTDELLNIGRLQMMENYGRERHLQCWADEVFGRGWNPEVDSCQMTGPFECGLGLCPNHCKEVHVCAS